MNTDRLQSVDYWIQPLLKALQELGGKAAAQEVRDRVAANEKLTEAELADCVGLTGLSRFVNKLAFARQYLMETGYMDNAEHGVWALTERGKKAELSPAEAAALVQEAVALDVPRDGERLGRVDYWIAPLLKALKELGGSAGPVEVRERIAANEKLTEAEKNEKVGLTGLSKFVNKVAFARQYLIAGGYMVGGSCRSWELTQRGRNAELSEAEIGALVRAAVALDAPRNGDRLLQAEYWFNPVLTALRELGGEAEPKAVRDRIAVNEKLTDAELAQTVGLTDLNKFVNKVTFARHYLATAGYVENGEGGKWKLTDKGRDTVLTDVQVKDLAREAVKLGGDRKQ